MHKGEENPAVTTGADHQTDSTRTLLLPPFLEKRLLEDRGIVCKIVYYGVENPEVHINLGIVGVGSYLPLDCR